MFLPPSSPFISLLCLLLSFILLYIIAIISPLCEGCLGWVAGGARGWVAGRAGFWMFLLPGFGVGSSNPWVLGTQPPCATQALNIPSLSVLGDKLGQERAHGLFYMLLQSEDDTPSEVGLNSVFCKMSGMNFSEERVIENYFRFKPTPVSGSVTCMSMSSSHAAVVNDDNKGVSTWGHGKDGALGLEGHLISNFDPPFPTPVTSINCQVKEVCCGAEFTLMLTNEGQVYSCGSGALGKLGHGDEKNRSLPSLVGYFGIFRLSSPRSTVSFH